MTQQTQQVGFGTKNIITAAPGPRRRVKTTGWDLLNLGSSKKTYSIDALSGITHAFGVVARVDRKDISGDVVMPESGFRSPEWKGRTRIKISFYEDFTSCLPVPATFAKASKGPHHGAIELLPYAVSEEDGVVPAVGSEVLCRIGNIYNLSNITFTVSSAASVKDTPAKNPRSAHKNPCDKCGQRAPGDTLPRNSSPSHNNKALPCLPKGKSSPDASKRTNTNVQDSSTGDDGGDILKQWSKMVKDNKTPGTNKVVTIGGKKTILYKPNKCDLAQNYELIYYLHNQKFGADFFDGQMKPVISEMLKGESGNSRNFVLVLPASPFEKIVSDNTLDSTIKQLLSISANAKTNADVVSIIASGNGAVESLKGMVMGSEFKAPPNNVTFRLVASPASTKQAHTIVKSMGDSKKNGFLHAGVSCEVLIAKKDEGNIQAPDGVTIDAIDKDYTDLNKASCSHAGCGGVGGQTQTSAPCEEIVGESASWHMLAAAKSKEEITPLLKKAIPGTRFQWKNWVKSWSRAPQNPGAWEGMPGVNINQIWKNINQSAIYITALWQQMWPEATEVKIHSGFRHLKSNNKADGSGRSPHMAGSATDIKVFTQKGGKGADQINSAEICNRIKNAAEQGIIAKGGLGLYNVFSHYDFGANYKKVFTSHDPKTKKPWHAKAKVRTVAAWYAKKTSKRYPSSTQRKLCKASWAPCASKTSNSPQTMGDGISIDDGNNDIGTTEVLSLDMDVSEGLEYENPEPVLTPSEQLKRKMLEAKHKSANPDTSKSSDPSNQISQVEKPRYKGRTGPEDCPQRTTMGNIGTSASPSAIPGRQKINSSVISAKDGTARYGSYGKISGF